MSNITLSNEQPIVDPKTETEYIALRSRELKIKPGVSYVDHALTPAHLALAVSLGTKHDDFFIETVELPEHLASLPCGLHGPTSDGVRVPEEEVTYAIRGKRHCASRTVHRPPFPSRKMTVIGGRDKAGDMFLLTAYGGPSAPREPGDRTIDTWEEVQASRAFWADHALSAG